jgi:hypothetical protein
MVFCTFAFFSLLCIALRSLHLRSGGDWGGGDWGGGVASLWLLFYLLNIGLLVSLRCGVHWNVWVRVAGCGLRVE